MNNYYVYCNAIFMNTVMTFLLTVFFIAFVYYGSILEMWNNYKKNQYWKNRLSFKEYCDMVSSGI
jgi:hypothetical protein